MFVFIIPMIPAAFHYRGVSVHAANRAICGNCTSVSISPSYPGFLSACISLTEGCDAAPGLGTAAAALSCASRALTKQHLLELKSIYFWILTFQIIPLASSSSWL